MGDVIAFPGAARRRASAGQGAAAFLDAALGPSWPSYGERLTAALMETRSELDAAADRFARCRAALDSGDIETMVRVRDALAQERPRAAR